MNGTGSTRDQMRHIIYININKGNGEPSIYMFSHLPFHPLTLTIFLPFPLTLPHHIPNIPNIPFPFSPFPPYPSILFPYFPPSLHIPSIPHPSPHSLSLTPQSRTIHIHRPYTLCHTFSHTHPYLLLYPRCTLSYPYSHVLLLSHQSHIHSILFHMKHNNNNSYFHFHIIYYILYNIIYSQHLLTIIHHKL